MNFAFCRQVLGVTKVPSLIQVAILEPNQWGMQQQEEALLETSLPQVRQPQTLTERAAAMERERDETVVSPYDRKRSSS